MNRSEVQTWLDRYLDAWNRNEPEPIEALFTDDAVYRYAPCAAARVEGHASIVEGWSDNADAPDDWDASYEVSPSTTILRWPSVPPRYFAKGDQAEKLYHNCFLLRFGPDGRSGLHRVPHAGEDGLIPG